MTTPMFVTNISFACHATQVGRFAQLSDIPHSHVRISRRLFRNADLAVLNTLAEPHSRTACWPLMWLGLLLDSPVWVSDTTSHLVETEEASFAVTRDPVKLPNIQRPVADFVVRLRIFPVTTDSGIHQWQSQIHLKPISAMVLINVPPPLMFITPSLCNIDRNHKHRMHDAVDAPIKDAQVESIGLQQNCPVCGVSIFVVHPIEVLNVVWSDCMSLVPAGVSSVPCWPVVPRRIVMPGGVLGSSPFSLSLMLMWSWFVVSFHYFMCESSRWTQLHFSFTSSVLVGFTAACYWCLPDPKPISPPNRSSCETVLIEVNGVPIK